MGIINYDYLKKDTYNRIWKIYSFFFALFRKSKAAAKYKG